MTDSWCLEGGFMVPSGYQISKNSKFFTLSDKT